MNFISCLKHDNTCKTILSRKRIPGLGWSHREKAFYTVATCLTWRWRHTTKSLNKVFKGQAGSLVNKHSLRYSGPRSLTVQSCTELQPLISVDLGLLCKGHHQQVRKIWACLKQARSNWVSSELALFSSPCRHLAWEAPEMQAKGQELKGSWLQFYSWEFDGPRPA